MDAELKILVCLTCQTALIPKAMGVIKHFNQMHCGRGETVEKHHTGLTSQLEQTLLELSFDDPKKVRRQPHDRAPVSGIKIRSGFYCPVIIDGTQCRHTAEKTSSIVTHIKTSHKTTKASNWSLEDYTCNCQTLFTSNLRMFFRVQAGLANLESSQNPYSVFLRQTISMPSPAPPPEPAKYDELPSFLRVTRWSEFLKPYRGDPKDVAALIQYPKPQTLKSPGADIDLERVLCKLPDVTKAWADTVHRQWIESSDYIQRTLARYSR